MKTRVLIVIPSFFPAIVYGGPIISSLNTCKKLVNLGMDISVCTTNANGVDRLRVETNRFVYNLGFPVKYYMDSLLGRFSLSLMLFIWRDILKAKVVHIQSIFSSPTPISLFYSWLFKRKVILSPRGSLGEWCLIKGFIMKKIWLKLLIKPFLRRVVWHATSEQEKQEILRLFGPQMIAIIPNGVDIDSFIANNSDNKYFYDKFGINDSSRIIVSMGRLERKKGFDILIESVFKLIHEGNNVRLFIAGPDYGELANLVALCHNLGIEDKVTFVGQIDGDNKINFLQSADVFAMPSHNENFGNVYAESLACGTPIVASTKTPWKDVELYSCGKWVDNTVDDTASAIFELLKRDRVQLRNNSKEFILKFSWHNVANEFKKLYEELE